MAHLRYFTVYLLQVLHKSLSDLLEYTGDDIEDVFMQTFRISYKDVFGCTLHHDLKDKGDTIAVTQENKMVCKLSCCCKGVNSCHTPT